MSSNTDCRERSAVRAATVVASRIAERQREAAGLDVRLVRLQRNSGRIRRKVLDHPRIECVVPIPVRSSATAASTVMAL